MGRPDSSKRVAVVMGGWSEEHEVSLGTGSAVAAALQRRGHRVVRVVIPKVPRGVAVDQVIDSGLFELVGRLRQAELDAVFLALHGRLGEDGCIQGMLELAGIPYTGASVLASALAMDKVMAKELFLLHNVPTPPYYSVSAADDLADIETIHGHFGFPVIVKPRSEGSSLGVSKAASVRELNRGLREVFAYDDWALVERFIPGAEVNVGILDGQVLGAIEIEPKGELYDYEAKYTQGASRYHMPARLGPARYQGVLNLAARAADALSCTGALRVDLLVTPGENEYVLEVNTLPGMTETSLLPKIAQAAGYDFGDLCEAILRSARLLATSHGRRSGPGRQSITVPVRPSELSSVQVAKSA